MKNKIIFFIKGTIFICIFFVLMVKLGEFFFSRSFVYSDSSYEAVKKLPKNSVDVILAGSSVVQNSILCLEMYKDTNMKVLSIASSAEPFQLTYEKVKEMYKYQKPKVVVVDLYQHFYNYENLDEVYEEGIINSQKKYLHFCLDITDFSIGKLKVIDNCVQTPYKLHYAFPLLYYHSNWKKMDEDVLEENKKFEKMNCILKNCKKQRKDVYVINRELPKKENLERIRKTTREEVIAYNAWYAIVNPYVYEIIELVKENDGIVIFTTTPKIGCEAELIISRLLQLEFNNDKNVKFINYLYEVEDFDFTTDLCDEFHLNYNGSKKITKYLKEYLLNEVELETLNFESNDIWNEAYEQYIQYMLNEKRIDVLNYKCN